MSAAPTRTRRIGRFAALAAGVVATLSLLVAPAQAATAATGTATASATAHSIAAVPGAIRPAVYSSCDVSGCADAVTAYDGWSQLGFPTSRGWYQWTSGQCNYAGGEYMNRDGQLPNGDTFWEYDVYPRSCGAHRDAYRIVVDADTGATWYSPDHYSTFYEIV